MPERITELPSLPAREEDSHKGTFGRVLLIAGSRGMSGGAALAGLGALRGGAGLVFVAVPQSILPIVAAIEPSYLTLPLPEDDAGRMTFAAHETLSEKLPDSTAVGVGPGWGQSDDLTALARWLYVTIDKPIVFDADGLNALAKQRDLLTRRLAAGGTGAPAGSGDPRRTASVPVKPRILTPHPGEFARLLDSDVTTIQQNREELAVRFARKAGVVLVLKGRHTIITDGERIAVNGTGNSGLATGGTGDVLTGLITALLAQGLPAFDAAQLAVHLHGLAGDLATEELSKPGLIASDLPRYVAKAWSRL